MARDGLRARRPIAQETRHIALEGRRLSYLLRRSVRRSFSLQIDEHGLRVNAPATASLREVEAFMREHQAWLLNNLARQAQATRSARFELADGAVLPLFGRSCRVQLVECSHKVEWLEDTDGAPVIRLPCKGNPMARLVAALRAAALSRFTARVAHYCQCLGVSAPVVRLSSARTRWGSCSSAGSIRLNWRLIHLRPELSDYVAAHEVAHLIEMNHSARFWSVVEGLCPQWRVLRAELRDAGLALPLIGADAAAPVGED